MMEDKTLTNKDLFDIVMRFIHGNKLNGLEHRLLIWRRRSGQNQIEFYYKKLKLGYHGRTMEHEAMRGAKGDRKIIDPVLEKLLPKDRLRLRNMKPRAHELFHVLRIYYGDTQATVAEQYLGISRAWLNQYENGRTDEKTELYTNVTHSIVYKYLAKKDYARVTAG